jgi:hypothetical protein
MDSKLQTYSLPLIQFCIMLFYHIVQALVTQLNLLMTMLTDSNKILKGLWLRLKKCKRYYLEQRSISNREVIAPGILLVRANFGLSRISIWILRVKCLQKVWSKYMWAQVSMILYKMVTKAVNNKYFMETNKSHRNSKAIKN